MSRYNFFLRTSNVLAFILVIAVNSVVNFKGDPPKSDEPVNNATQFSGNWTVPETYLLPADYTFGIWGLIYTLLFGFIIYQWFESAQDATIDGIKFYHVIASILNISWSLIWGDSKIRILIDAFVLAALFAVTYKAYYNLKTHYPPKNNSDRLFIHYPFTIYAAWTLISTILNFWAAIPLLNNVFFSTIAIIGLGIAGHDYNKNHDNRSHDVVYSATIAWALIGIAVRQQDTLAILIASSVSSGVILGGILRVWYTQVHAYWELRRNRLRGIDESDPLIP
uniref:Plasma membrane ATPase n=1 Tax=Anthurium amnicola TaxID=1678845 RepID=A0A1D1XZB7_9ARAE